jgi:hypothetical protein
MTNKALDDFVAQLLQTGGQFTLLINHMCVSASADAAPIPEVLTGLLKGVLEPLLMNRGPDEIQLAADVLAEAIDVIGEELILVPPPAA